MRRLRTAPRVLLPAVLFGLAVFWSTITLTEPPGPGLDPDALSYLGAGSSLGHGHGLRVPSASWSSNDSTAPLVHFPPGFPAAIAVGVAAGASPMNTARFIEASAAAVTTVAIMLAASAAAGPAAGIAAIGVAAATPALLMVHSSVLSEPLFLALLALFTWQLARERHTQDTKRTLLLGALAAAATLVRYAGASLVLAVVAEAWWTVDGSWRTTWRARARRAFVAAELPVVALAIWTFTRPHSEDAEKIRDVGIYTAGLGHTLLSGLRTMGRWLTPGVASGSGRAVAAVLVFAALVALVTRSVRAWRRGLLPVAELRLHRAVAIVLVSYAAVVAASRLLADPGIPLDERMLSPAFLLVALWLGVSLAAFWRDCFSARREIIILTAGITASWIWGSAQVGAEWAGDFTTEGGDLGAHEWAASPLVAWAAAAPPGTTLYSNWPAAIWFHTARPTHEIPSDLDSSTALEFRAKIEREHGALLAFTARAGDYALPDSLAAMAGLVAVERWPGGTIWRAPPDTVRIHP
ncbi:MAG TPA: glycosyltransferase family 39 protein [Gemmatimonadaceae bacterium]